MSQLVLKLIVRIPRASLLTAMNNIRELHEPRARHILSDKHSIEERLLEGAEKSYGSADWFGVYDSTVEMAELCYNLRNVNASISFSFFYILYTHGHTSHGISLIYSKYCCFIYDWFLYVKSGDLIQRQSFNNLKCPTRPCLHISI